jgi:hypothetical protein
MTSAWFVWPAYSSIGILWNLNSINWIWCDHLSKYAHIDGIDYSTLWQMIMTMSSLYLILSILLNTVNGDDTFLLHYNANFIAWIPQKIPLYHEVVFLILILITLIWSWHLSSFIVSLHYQYYYDYCDCVKTSSTFKLNINLRGLLFSSWE